MFLIQVRQPLLQEHPGRPGPAQLRRGAADQERRDGGARQGLRRRRRPLLPALRAVDGEDGQHLAADRSAGGDQEELQEAQRQLTTTKAADDLLTLLFVLSAGFVCDGGACQMFCLNKQERLSARLPCQPIDVTVELKCLSF